MAEKKKNFADNFNKIVATSFEQNPSMTLNFVLQENKKSGLKYLAMRQFTKTDSYEGPTKNGFSFCIESEDEIEELQNAFNEFFEAAKSHI